MYSPASVWETFSNSVQTPAMHTVGETTPSVARSYFSLIVCEAALWIAENKRNVLSQSSGCTKFINTYCIFENILINYKDQLSDLYSYGCMECGAMLSRLYEIWQRCYQILVGSSACDYSA